MAADAHKNFAASLVATAPSPATSGTSLVVTTGDGSKFPAVPFNATIWPASTQPTTANAEIVRVTAISTDTLTITRAQESTSARTVVVGDQIAATITAKTLTDIEQGTGILALTSYAPSTQANYTVTGTTTVDVDATNLAVTFTAPKSGSVLVGLSALCDMSVTTSAACYWALREGSTTLMTSVAQVLNGANGISRRSVETVITGLTPGSSHTYKWAWGTNNVPTGKIFAGNANADGASASAGPAIMKVTALP